MSVSYGEKWNVIIHGEKDRLPALKSLVEDYYSKNDQSDYCVSNIYDDAMEEIEKAEKSGSGEFSLSLCYDGADGDHGYFDPFLNSIGDNVSGLLIAIEAIYEDYEYGEGDSLVHWFRDTSDWRGVCFDDVPYAGSDELPDYDWIPSDWKMDGVPAPYAKAEGTIELIGSWGEERKYLDEALLDGGLLDSLPYIIPLPGNEDAFSETEGGYEFHLGGEIEFSDGIQEPDIFFGPYIKNHEKEYSDLAAKMREKHLCICVIADESSGAKDSWHYPNSSAWHFLIYSDGNRLHTLFLACATYAFGGSAAITAPAMAAFLYNKATGGALEKLELRDRVKHTLDFIMYSSSHPVKDQSDDAYDDEFDDDEFDEFCDSEYDAVMDSLEEYFDEHKDELIKLFADKAEKPAKPEKGYIPSSYDGRFAGKTFVVKGDFKKYTRQEIEQIINGFGGKVGKNVTKNVNGVVFGSGVGSSVETVLDHGTEIITEEYFEDCIR